MSQSSLQRDSIITFLETEKELAKKISFISPDFGARPLDEFRESSADRFVYTGIAEQLTADLAYGISLAGRLPIIYGMSPFISARAYEQYKVLFGQTTQPLCLLPVGVGLGYDHNTCSHYSLDDIGLYSSVNGMSISTPCDNLTAIQSLQNWIRFPSKKVIRLERQPMPDNIFTSFPSEDIHTIDNLGYLFNRSSDTLVVSWGYLGTSLLDATAIQNCSVLLITEIDTLSITSSLCKLFNNNFQKIIVTEESYYNSGVAPYVAKSASQFGINCDFFHVDHSIAQIRAHRSSIWDTFNLNLKSF